MLHILKCPAGCWCVRANRGGTVRTLFRNSPKPSETVPKRRRAGTIVKCRFGLQSSKDRIGLETNVTILEARKRKDRRLYQTDHQRLQCIYGELNNVFMPGVGTVQAVARPRNRVVETGTQSKAGPGAGVPLPKAAAVPLVPRPKCAPPAHLLRAAAPKMPAAPMESVLPPAPMESVLPPAEVLQCFCECLGRRLCCIY